MPTKVLLKPNPAHKVDGVAVRVYDPAHRDFLPVAGREIMLNTYWVNRLRCGEVIRVDNTKTPDVAADKSTNVLANIKSKKDVIAYARENIGDEFADSLDEKSKLDELKAAVLAEINK